MTDPDTTVEAISDKTPIEISSTTGMIVIGLATYGALSMIDDAKSLVTKIRRNRKAKKAEEKAVAANNPPTEK